MRPDLKCFLVPVDRETRAMEFVAVMGVFSWSGDNRRFRVWFGGGLWSCGIAGCCVSQGTVDGFWGVTLGGLSRVRGSRGKARWTTAQLHLATHVAVAHHGF